MRLYIIDATITLVNKSTKGTIHFLLLLTIAFIAFAGIEYWAYKNGQIKLTPTQEPTVVSPTPDPTADWETYDNPLYKYSFKYPVDMTLTDYNEGNFRGIQLTLIGPTQKASGRTQTSLAEGAMIKTLLIPALDAQEEAESTRHKELNVPEGDASPDVSQTKEIVIDGEVAYQYTAKGMGNVKVTYIPIDGNTLRFAGYYDGFDGKQIRKYEELVDQILSTFKFTDGNQSNDKVEPEVYEAFKSKQRVSVLVDLKNTPLELKNTKDLDSLKKEVSLVQDNVLSGLDPSEYSITYKYEGLSVLALQITESALEKLNSNPLVEGVGTSIKLKVDDNFEPIE